MKFTSRRIKLKFLLSNPLGSVVTSFDSNKEHVRSFWMTMFFWIKLYLLKLIASMCTGFSCLEMNFNDRWWAVSRSGNWGYSHHLCLKEVIAVGMKWQRRPCRLQ